MLQSKDINKISELKNGFTPRWLEPDFISSSLKSFSFSRLCRIVSQVKSKGYEFEWIMTILLSMPFIDAATIHSMLNGCVKHYIEARKDVFYRLKNHPGICWRIMLWQFAIKFRSLTEKPEDSTGGPKCMIFDDTLLEKIGMKIEKVSRMWDHVLHRYVFGFKLLLLGYWDGTSFIPLDFSLHRERGTNKEKPFGLTRRSSGSSTGSSARTEVFLMREVRKRINRRSLVQSKCLNGLLTGDLRWIMYWLTAGLPVKN